MNPIQRVMPVKTSLRALINGADALNAIWDALK